MSELEAVFLGLIQGFTEFLPVSSSGHLTLAQLLLGLKGLQRYLLFDLVCHLGTLLAILWFFLPRIKELLNQNPRLVKQIIVATLPLFPIVLIMKPIKRIFDQPELLGYCFLFTSFLLFLGHFVQRRAARKPWRDPLVIGLFQAIAVLPGVSRSGSTISAARLLGWSYEEAATFSFLLAIPAILGAATLETFNWIREPTLALAPISGTSYLLGFVVAFISGCFALNLLMRLAAKGRFVYFAWYCATVGILAMLLI